MFSFEGASFFGRSHLYRGIVQLVERWSPKPNVEGSNPSAPAIFFKNQNDSPFSYGSVAQLVRVPACHAGGRGFEPLLSRFVETISFYN